MPATQPREVRADVSLLLPVAPLAALVPARHRADPVRHLVSSPAGRADQRVVRHVLRSHPACARQAGSDHDGRVLGPDRNVLSHCHALRDHRGRAGLLRQALHLPLAHGDERLLHGALAQAAPYRRGGATGAGRHHALCQHHGKPGRGLHAQRDGACSVPAHTGDAVGEGDRAALFWSGTVFIGLGGDRLCAGGHGPACCRRHQAARAAIPEPTGRGGIPQGTRVRRGRREPRVAAGGGQTVRGRALQLFPPVLPLPLLRRGEVVVPAVRRAGALHCAGPDACGRRGHPGGDAADRARIRARGKRVPVPGPQLEHGCRADVRLQALARFRAADRAA